MNNAQGTPLSRRKKLLFYLASYTLIALLLFSLAEGIARLKGFRPWEVKQAEIMVEPGGKFFRANPTLGYTHLPGQFKITLAGAYTFKATNLENTLRITHPLATYQSDAARKQIWILGDSITYGWSVNDEEAYAWLLQESFPDYEVVNFGVSGYGTLHSLIQLREALATAQAPRVVVLSYASWHDVRNTFIRIRRKMLAPSASLGPLNQPYARLTRDGRLDIFMDTVEYREFPLMRRSAFMHALEETYDNYEERHAHSHEVTKAIIKEMLDLCRAHNIEMVFASLTSDPTTSDMSAYCQGLGIKTVSIYVDLNIKENNNLPYDSHPSALAHKQYAQKLETFLRTDVLKGS
jgi:GDSL-like Lipase/Acylhydrolase family